MATKSSLYTLDEEPLDKSVPDSVKLYSLDEEPVPRETLPTPGDYKPGVISPESIAKQQETIPYEEQVKHSLPFVNAAAKIYGISPRVPQTVARAGAGFAEGIARMAQDIPGSLARVMSPQNAMVAQQLDLGHPYKRIELVKQMEQAGILAEAHGWERWGQRVGEIGAFLAPVGAAERGLIGLGLAPRMANLVALGGATALQSAGDARARGVPMGPKEVGSIAGQTALGLVGGAAASKGIEAGVSKILGSEVGKSLGVYLGHAALGALFEGISPGQTPQERKENMLAGAVAFTLGANHQAVFQGYSKARSERQWLDSSKAMADELVETRPDLDTPPRAPKSERRLGVPEGAREPIGPIRKTLRSKAGQEFLVELPRPTGRPETQAERVQADATGVGVRTLQARFFYQNATNGPHMPYEAGISPDMLKPDFIAHHFEIPLEQARRIVDRGTDPREAREIVQDKRQEAVLIEAEKRGAQVAAETRYRLNLMDPLEKLTYERKRAEFTPEEQAAVSAIPAEKEALAAMEADVAAMEQQLEAQPSQQERAYILQRQAEEGRLNRLQAQPELQPMPLKVRLPPTEVLRTPRKAAGQQEQQFRMERRAAQQARQAGQGPPVAEAPLPPPVEPRPAAGVSLPPVARPKVAPPRPAGARVQEVEGVGRVSVMQPEERVRKAVEEAPHQSYGALFEPKPERLAQLDAERQAHIVELNGLVDKIKDQRVKSAVQRGLFEMEENLRAREAEKPQLSPEEKRRKPKPPCKG